MLLDFLTQTIDTLTELKRMSQLNFELLEQLSVACDYLMLKYPDSPNNQKLASLLSKSMALLNEIKGESPKILQYRKIADESSHGDKTARDFTEPFI